MTGAEYQAMRRKEARANGLCGTCYLRPAELIDLADPSKGTRFRCVECAARHAGKQITRQQNVESRAPLSAADRSVAANWNDCCIASGFHRFDCPTRNKRAA